MEKLLSSFRCFPIRNAIVTSFALILVGTLPSGHVTLAQTTANGTGEEGHESEGIVLVELNWDYISGPMITVIFLLIVSLVALRTFNLDLFFWPFVNFCRSTKR